MIRDFLFNWQTLVGSIFAALVAVGAAIVAWKAAIKQIAAIQSERDRRFQYAAGIAGLYLVGVKEILAELEREERNLAGVTEDTWRNNPGHIVSVLQSAQTIFLEPTGYPQSDDVEQYREELPLYLFANLRLVFKLEKNLGETVGQLLAQQRVFGAFPLSDCQMRLRLAVVKLKSAIDGTEYAFERFKYE